MSISELKVAIKSLPANEVAQLTDWLVDYHDRTWDDQIEGDLESGKLDKLLDKIDIEYESIDLVTE